MTELDGPIQVIPDAQVQGYTEAPWIHKRKGIYYLATRPASGEASYSTAPRITGPWTPRGLLAEGAFNSNTSHEGIITFRASITWSITMAPCSLIRSSAPQQPSPLRLRDYLYYNPDGSIRRVSRPPKAPILPPAKFPAR